MKLYGDSKEAGILESAKCRQIVSEIMNFGVNQGQIKTLIRLLALELESRDLMIAVRECVDSFEESDAKLDNEIIT